MVKLFLDKSRTIGPGDRLGRTGLAPRLDLPALLLALCLPLVAPVRAAPGPAYGYFAIGDPRASVAIPDRPRRPSFMLMGGGEDVDAAFRWMKRKAGVRPGSGGHFVVLRAGGSAAYNPYVYFSGPGGTTAAPAAPRWVGGAALGLSSVETVVVPSRAAADDPVVNRIVGRADAVFIAGGDQSDYIRYWKGSALDRTLHRLLHATVPIGGTSAGLAILGAFNFAALHGTIDSAAALSDPFDPRITLDPDPLDPAGGFLALTALADTITDSHFVRRDRMGRLVSFMARLVAQGDGGGCRGGVLPVGRRVEDFPRGIGVSEQTALLVEEDGTGKHFIAHRIRNPWTDKDAAVYFVRPLEAPSTCAPGQPLTLHNVEIRKLDNSGTVFDLSDWSGAKPHIVNVQAGRFDSSPY
jgi:cyanophycinase-like exopeptidase